MKGTKNRNKENKHIFLSFRRRILEQDQPHHCTLMSGNPEAAVADICSGV